MIRIDVANHSAPVANINNMAFYKIKLITITESKHKRKQAADFLSGASWAEDGKLQGRHSIALQLKWEILKMKENSSPLCTARLSQGAVTWQGFSFESYSSVNRTS